MHAAVVSRIEVATAAGLTPLAERYRHVWTPEHGLPPRPGRLTFRADDEDTAFWESMRRVHHGSLDARQVRTLESEGIEASVEQEFDHLRWLPSPRSWWRLADDQEGALVGFVVPAHHHSDHLIAFVGVLPEFRGRGYAYDLLVEGTHVLVAEGADRIVAGTDVTNSPMVATFARAGYAIEQHRLDFV